MQILIRIVLGIISPILTIGVGFFFLFINKKVNREQNDTIRRCTSIVQGTVKKVERKELGFESEKIDRSYIWIPYIAYNIQGIEYENRGNGHEPGYYIEGQSVTIHYDPFDPNHFYVEGDQAPEIIEKNLKIAGIILVPFGIIWFIFINLILNLIYI